jgi:hypothetical protein
MNENIDLNQLDQCLATHSYSDIDQSVWDEIDRHFAQYGNVLDSKITDALVNRFKRSQIEAYRKLEKERLEAKAKEKFLATVNENHSQVNADAIADQLAKLINSSSKPRRKAFWEL